MEIGGFDCRRGGSSSSSRRPTPTAARPPAPLPALRRPAVRTSMSSRSRRASSAIRWRGARTPWPRTTRSGRSCPRTTRPSAATCRSCSTRTATACRSPTSGARRTSRRPTSGTRRSSSPTRSLDPDDQPNFVGTSAAAPHAAGIAALALQARGGPRSLSPAAMSALLRRSAFSHDLDPIPQRGIDGRSDDHRGRSAGARTLRGARPRRDHPGSKNDPQFFTVQLLRARRDHVDSRSTARGRTRPASGGRRPLRRHRVRSAALRRAPALGGPELCAAGLPVHRRRGRARGSTRRASPRSSRGRASGRPEPAVPADDRPVPGRRA